MLDISIFLDFHSAEIFHDLSVSPADSIIDEFSFHGAY